jgi:hypothetical protein
MSTLCGIKWLKASADNYRTQRKIHTSNPDSGNPFFAKASHIHTETSKTRSAIPQRPVSTQQQHQSQRFPLCR